MRSLPDVLLAPDPSQRNGRRPRLINTGYGGSVRSSFSGSSAYLAQAGMDAGVLDGVFELYSTERPDRQLQARGALWKLARIARRQQTGGFKFSPQFSSHLWHRHLRSLAGVDVISNFQLLSDEFFARRAVLDIGAYFYIDGTLHDYLRGYRDFDAAGIDPAIIAAAMETERRGYELADAVAVMSSFTADTLRVHYNVPSERIHVIAPGANLPDVMAERVMAARAARPASAEVVIGFVGVYPERKGLPKLARVVAALRHEGVPLRLRIVGRCPDEIATMDGVEALGYISKSADPDHFAEALAGMDLGVQLSSAEMYGIAILEFLRCGIPVMASEVGGVVDVMRRGASLRVPGDADDEMVADQLRRFVEDRELRSKLEGEAAQASSAVRWEATALALDELVTGTGAGSAGSAPHA